MLKKIAIHQPNYLPWMGYFIKMAMCDVFVLHDIVEYTKSGVTRRVKVADFYNTPATQWLTVPLENHSDFSKIIELKIKTENWIDKHLSYIKTIYKNAPFYDECFGVLSTLLLQNKHETSLTSLNSKLIIDIAKLLGLHDIQFINSTEMDGLEGLKADCLNLAIVRNLGGNVYLCGHGGKNYQNESLFKEASIDVVYVDSMQRLKEYNYSQVVSTENYGVSIIDMWMNVGLEEMKTFLCRLGETPINTKT